MWLLENLDLLLWLTLSKESAERAELRLHFTDLKTEALTENSVQGQSCCPHSQRWVSFSHIKAASYQDELNRPTMSPAEQAFSPRTTKVGWNPLMLPSLLQRPPQTKQTSPWVCELQRGAETEEDQRPSGYPLPGRAAGSAPRPRGGHSQAPWRRDPSYWLATRGFQTLVTAKSELRPQLARGAVGATPGPPNQNLEGGGGGT